MTSQVQSSSILTMALKLLQHSDFVLHEKVSPNRLQYQHAMNPLLSRHMVVERQINYK